MAAILKLAIHPPNINVLYGRLAAYPPNLARYTATNPYIHAGLGRYTATVDLIRVISALFIDIKC